MFWGKVAGLAFGYLLGGYIGAFLGLIIGHFFDRGLQQAGMGPWINVGDVLLTQEVFFNTTFSVMGCIAKSDGRVSQQEISMAELAMQRMQLNPQRRKRAIEFFNQGKKPDFDLDRQLKEFVERCSRHVDLVRMFLEIQIAIALADGQLKSPEKRILYRIAEQIGFPQSEMDRIIRMITAEQHQYQRGTQGHVGPRTTVDDAYAILGVDEKATDDEVKKAYRRLMNQHHPDKLVAKGLPKDMIKLATEKTQEIKDAYEAIKQHRGSRH